MLDYLRFLFVTFTIIAAPSALASETMPADQDEQEYTVVDTEGKVHITWQRFDKYSDIKPTASSRSRFRKRLFSTLDRYLEKMASDMPEGYRLEMIVTNIDLAGQVWPAMFGAFGMGANDIRVVDRAFIPRFKFSYQLFDESNVVIANEIDVDLKELNFLEVTARRFNGDAFRHEKVMFERWFRRTLKPYYLKQPS